MPTIRVAKTKDSFAMRTEALLDPRLSSMAKAVLSTAIALAHIRPHDIDDLLMCFGEDADEVYRAIMELRTYGYCKRSKVEDETQFKFYDISRKASRVKNKNPYSYSKNMAQVQGPPKQIDESAYTRDDAEFDGWDELDQNPQGPNQPSFLPDKKSKTDAPTHSVIPMVSHHTLYRICFLAETESEMRLVSSGNRGRVASALGHLRSAGGDLSQLNRFEDWWNNNWRCRSSTGQYQPPSPEQVIEFWPTAMKHNYKPTQKVPRPVEPEIDLSALMLSKRNHD